MHEEHYSKLCVIINWCIIAVDIPSECMRKHRSFVSYSSLVRLLSKLLSNSIILLSWAFHVFQQKTMLILSTEKLGFKRDILELCYAMRKLAELMY
jgi:hypothetical protein